MSFKDSVLADNRRVFLNSAEFADEYLVRYDGETYGPLPIVLVDMKETDRSGSNEVEGLFLVSTVAYIFIEDLDGIVPEKGSRIQIEDGTSAGYTYYKDFKIVTSSCEGGMIVLNLEAVDE